MWVKEVGCNVLLPNLKAFIQALRGGIFKWPQPWDFAWPPGTLSEVEITIYFLDKNGKEIAEKSYSPVLVVKNNFYPEHDNKPLKPNYVKDFGYIVEDDAQSLWRGEATAKITDIEFEGAD